MVALLADILTLLAATVYASFINAGGLSISNLNVVLYFVVVIMLLRIIRRVAWWNPQLFSRMFDGNDPDELGIRSSIALMLVLVGVSVFFDIEPILGAFLAGNDILLIPDNLEKDLKVFKRAYNKKIITV